MVKKSVHDLLFLPKRAIRPFADNLDRQRQFVTDASHELKTPLAILSADLGLLEDTYGKDQWLDNTVKYCDPAGAIQLTVSQRGRNICISVSNPCSGIETAQLPHYFDRFYRADPSRDRSTGSYGIGLSTAKSIVTRHRGRITNHYADGIITFTATIPQSG